MSNIHVTERDNGLRILTLDRQERRNALDLPMCADLGAAIDAVAADAGARALVVTGAGSAFCAGADLPALFGDAGLGDTGFGDTGQSVGGRRTHLLSVYASFLRLRELAIPTVAAVHGPAVGAGLNLALSCDVRIAGPEASFAASFTRIGLHPGGGCTWFLVDVLGRQRALALLLSGGTVDGPAAVPAGLALELADDPVLRAVELAQAWCQVDPDLVRNVKTAVGIAAESGFRPALEFEAWAQADSAGRPAVREVVDRFRRLPAVTLAYPLPLSTTVNVNVDAECCHVDHVSHITGARPVNRLGVVSDGPRAVPDGRVRRDGGPPADRAGRDGHRLVHVGVARPADGRLLPGQVVDELAEGRTRGLLLRQHPRGRPGVGVQALRGQGG
jgi:enoyl-CoA hydratase